MKQNYKETAPEAIEFGSWKELFYGSGADGEDYLGNSDGLTVKTLVYVRVFFFFLAEQEYVRVKTMVVTSKFI